MKLPPPPLIHRRTLVWTGYAAGLSVAFGVAIAAVQANDNPLAAACGAVAAICIFIPICGYDKHRAETAITNEAQSTMQAYKLAGDAHIQRIMDKRQADGAQILRLIHENARLAEQIPARMPNGRFAPRAKTILIPLDD